MSDCNVLLLNVQLQEAFDAHAAKNVGGLESEEHGIHARTVFMSNLMRDLRAKRMDKKESDQIVLDDATRAKIRDFRETHWPELARRHEGIITDGHNPFPDDVRGPVVGREIDDMIDRLSVLLDQEQSSLTHVTRKLKSQVDLAYHCTTMTAERARSNPNKRFVDNQKTQP